VTAEIADELNVKRIDPIADLEGLLQYSVVPNFARLGPRAGGQMPELKAALSAADGGEVRRALAEDGTYTVDLGSGAFEIGPDDVEVRATSHDEFALAQEGMTAVALDTTLDDDLRREGVAREIVRALNDLRKAYGFEIADRILVWLRADGLVRAALDTHCNSVATEVLAVEFDVADPDGDEGSAGFEKLEIDAEVVWARLERTDVV
jgi:isoleucyl-tRNA synthetase